MNGLQQSSKDYFTIEGQDTVFQQSNTNAWIIEGGDRKQEQH